MIDVILGLDIRTGTGLESNARTGTELENNTRTGTRLG